MAAIETEFAGQPVVVIGAHSPKFPNEADPDRVREAVARYNVTHPVMVDNDFAFWNQHAVDAWPTIVVVDPRGYVVEKRSGEPEAARLSALVKETLMAQAEALNEDPLPIVAASVTERPLRFPGKILCHGDRLFIGDTGHHQVVEVDAKGTELRRFGSGASGMSNGDQQTAEFNGPNGLAVHDDILYVADTGNHLIRSIDLGTGEVDRVAGTGRRGRRIHRGGPFPALEIDLRSPWDLATYRGGVAVAMAGSHQLWNLDVADGSMTVLAGTGREARWDGPATSAALAQPSGLSALGDSLFIADSEISALRVLAPGPMDRDHLMTLTGGDLFEFGFTDGNAEDARFQHPIGIAASADGLLVADTFNHSLRLLDPGTQSVRTLHGNGSALVTDATADSRMLDVSSPGFHEPEDVDLGDGRIFVADTNNHRIAVIEAGVVSTFFG